MVILKNPLRVQPAVQGPRKCVYGQLTLGEEKSLAEWSRSGLLLVGCWGRKDKDD